MKTILSHQVFKAIARLLPTLLILFSIRASYPQSTQSVVASGTIMDGTTGKPLQFASASLLTLKDSTLVKGCISDVKGAFVFSNVTPGIYRLRLSFIGYSTLRKMVTIRAGADNQRLGSFTLSETNAMMKEVVITATLPVVVKKDTLEYNADLFKVEKNAVVEDMLKKLPGVEIDGTGKITAQGTDVTKVYVDGKQFFGNDPLIASQNLPADMIAKVQVIDKKSDQAEFSGVDDGQVDKIINIVTRQGYKHGSFGKASAGYGSNDRYDNGLMFNNFNGDRQISLIGMANNTNNLRFTLDASNILNNRPGSTLSTARFNRIGGGGRGGGGFGGAGGAAALLGAGGFSAMTAAGRGLAQSGISITDAAGLNFHDHFSKKIEFTGSYFFNANNKTLDQLTLTQTLKGDSSISKHDTSTNITRTTNHRINLELNYQIDSMNSILFRPSMSYVLTNSEKTSNSLTEGASGFKLNESTSAAQTDGNSWNSAATLLFRHKFNKPRRTFSLNLTGSLTASNNTNYNQSTITEFITSTHRPSVTQNNLLFDNTSGRSGYSARASYTEPLTTYFTLEVNYYYSLAKNSSHRTAYDYNELTRLYDKTDSTYGNRYDNTFINQRLGVSLQNKHDKLIYTLGLGIESSQIDSRTRILDTLFNRSHRSFDFSPTASLYYSFTTKSRLSFQYRGTTNEPSVDQLQPVVSDPGSLTIRKGNPDLKSSFTNDISLGYNDIDTKTLANYFVNFQYSNVLNDISNNYINGPSGEQIIVPVNVNGAYDAGLNIGMGRPIAKNKYSINTSGSLRWNNDLSYVRNTSTPLTNNTVIDLTPINLNTTRTLTAGFNFAGNINGKVLMFTAAARINYNRAWQSIQTSTNTIYMSYNYLADLKLNLPKGLLIASDIQYNVNTGYGAGFNKSYALWNGSVTKDILKNKKAQAKFQIYDLLQQNQSIRRTVNGANITDTQSTILPHYFLISLIYNFNNFLPPGSPLPMDNMRQRFGGFGRGGNPPGGGGF